MSRVLLRVKCSSGTCTVAKVLAHADGPQVEVRRIYHRATDRGAEYYLDWSSTPLRATSDAGEPIPWYRLKLGCACGRIYFLDTTDIEEDLVARRAVRVLAREHDGLAWTVQPKRNKTPDTPTQ